MLRAFLVDDEPLARDEFIYLLRKTKQVEIVGESDSVADTMECIQQNQIDVIFIDIQLAEESGLDLAGKLLNLENCPMIVFATAYDEFALKAFEVNAVDYILKPYDEERVCKTIEKVRKLKENRSVHKPSIKNSTSRLVERSEKLAITFEERIVLLNLKEINYVGTIDGKTVVVTKNQKYHISEPLVNIEKKIQHRSFVRVHRAFLVNIDTIVEIEPWFHSTYNLLMADGSKVPVSRTFTKDLKQILGF
jgi:two-component system, LytTR family, response regulator LytT